MKIEMTITGHLVDDGRCPGKLTVEISPDLIAMADAPNGPYSRSDGAAREVAEFVKECISPRNIT
ncbi:MAG: hypothetical protein VX529_10440 [Pseudomonadota bacterium]|nr:hypothetical protein [Pseudomonadota bacterium]